MNRIIKFFSPVIIVIAMLFILPVSASAVSGQEIVNYARQYIGCAYVRNTHGPSTFDCSGFVYYVFSHFGINLSLSSNDYFTNPGKFGTVVGTGSTANAKAGDLISWSGHVAIYTENGKCVEALNSRYGVTEAIAVNSHTNGMNYKVIRVNGIGAAAADTEAPTITNAKTTDITISSFKVRCSFSDNVGVAKAIVEVVGPKTTKSYVFNTPSADFVYTVNTSNFDGAGEYKVTITAYDEAGNKETFTLGKVTIAPHNHTFTSKVTTEATCTKAGVKTFTCSCGYSYTEAIPAKGHTPGSWAVTQTPTATKAGERTLFCAVCSEAIKKETLPKLGASSKNVYSVSISDISVLYKKTKTITPVINADSGADYKISFSSSDPSVASVDSNGTVKGLKKGTATITVTVIDQQGRTVTDTCSVTVKFSTMQTLIWMFALGFLWY